MGRSIQCVAAIVFLAAHRPQPELGGATAPAEMSEIAPGELNQIRRHFWRGTEADRRQGALSGALGNGHVRQRHPPARNRDSKLEHRPKGRLVPARKQPSRVGGFQFGGKQLPRGSARICIGLQEQPLWPLFDLAAIVEGQPMSSHARRVRKTHGRQLLLIVRGGCGGRLAIESHVSQGFVEGIEDDSIGAGKHLQRDRFVSDKAQCLDVRRHRDVIVFGHYILR